jgi:hypothetical protein
MFQLIEELRNKPNPSNNTHPEPQQRCNDLAAYFKDKISNLRTELAHQSTTLYGTLPIIDRKLIPMKLDNFSNLSTTDIISSVNHMKSKHCILDPIPTWLVKECLDVLAPMVTTIVNMSLSSAIFPLEYKCARILPILKQASLDPLVNKNLRPISLLAFLSKVIEREVAHQVSGHLTTNNLYEPFQSAYRVNHSVETALTRVHNDISISLDKGKYVLLIMLDLSAAFDTIDHTILLNRLDTHFGIVGSVLQWFRNYLTDRSQTVTCGNSESLPVTLACGVPQGSVLGPLLFSLYMAPLGDLLRELGMEFHCYADDTQLYMSVDTMNSDLARSKLEVNLKYIQTWMSKNLLKLNPNKTEYIVLSSSKISPPSNILSITFNHSLIEATAVVRNLGVHFDNNLTLTKHVNNVCSATYYQLRNIRSIQHYLPTTAITSLVHSLITSRLDYCNVLLTGYPEGLIYKLQKLQNAAARLITNSDYRAHMTPVLEHLHWLPVRQRCIFKLLLLTHKCIHHDGPDYLKSLLTYYTPNRELRSSSDTLILIVPQIQTKYGKQAFSYLASHHWNRLPLLLRSCQQTLTFKNMLKTHLFTQHYH